MADDADDAARQEKLAAARKRFEELKKKQDKKPKKKNAGKKGKAAASASTSATEPAAEGDDEPAAALGDDTPERTESPATVPAGTETPLPPESQAGEEEGEEESAVEVADAAADDVAALTIDDDKEEDDKEKEEEEEVKATGAEIVTEKEPSPSSAATPEELRAHLNALELENAALKDSLATANAKIQLDATTIAALQSEKSQSSSPTPSSQQHSPEYYRNLEEKFSREAQERYLLERDYAALKRTYDKLVSSHNAVLHELETLKLRFSAEEKRRQIPDAAAAAEATSADAAASPAKSAPMSPTSSGKTVPDINARLQAGKSSFFRTAQGLSAAVVKGVTGGANAVISEGPGYVQRQLSSPGAHRANSSTSYTDVELYGDDAVPEEFEGDSEAAYLRELERSKKAAEEASARQEWIKSEMDKWKGYRIDLEKEGGSGAGHGEIFVV